MAGPDKIPHVDTEDDHIDTVISHIISPYPISISWITKLTREIAILIYRILNRYPISHIDIHIAIDLMSDLPHRYPIPISHIDIGS